MADNLVITLIGEFIDMLKYQIDTGNKILLEKLNLDEVVKNTVKDIIYKSHIIIKAEDVIESENENADYIIETIDTIIKYLEEVTVGDFFMDYLKCVYNMDLRIEEIYKCKILPNDKIVMVNGFNNEIKYDKSEELMYLIHDKLYIIKNGKISESEIKSEFTIDFVKRNMTINNECNNLFWGYYYLTHKYGFYKIIYNVKQRIYDLLTIYHQMMINNRTTFNNVVDVLGNLPIKSLLDRNNFMDIRTINKFIVDNNVLNYRQLTSSSSTE